MKEVIAVRGMHCASCEGTVEAALRAIGARDVHADAARSSVVFQHDGLTRAVIERALHAAGPYAIVRMSMPAQGALRRVAPLLFFLAAVTLFATAKNTLAAPSFAWHAFMLDWMGGFFLLFGGLKVANLTSFARMYQGYDIAAKRFPRWGQVYPFIEVGLGVLFMARAFLPFANVMTVALMGFGMVGIYTKLRTEGEVQCACLGGFFNVPVTYLTLVENGVMVLMAAWMLLG